MHETYVDYVRIRRVKNGYTIEGRPIGTPPQSYALTEKAVAISKAQIYEWLTAHLVPEGHAVYPIQVPDALRGGE